MDSLIITAYEISASFIQFIIIMIFLNYQHKKQGICVSKMYCGIMTVFAVYIIAVFHFTSTGTLYDALLYKLELKQGQLNFIPFSNDIDITAYLQNILLFIPFGFLLPFICKQKVNIINILSTAFTFSLLIEVSQLLNNRRTDIDDLILNTFGAVIGFI
ncbi:MAG: VanZ family protein, partial [Ruminococcus sp.]|nr:VanZ family protein [Ruminococcus sp.]